MEIMKDKRVSVKFLFILLFFLSCVYLSCSAPTPFNNKDISSEVTETISLGKSTDIIERNTTADNGKEMATGRPYNFDTLDVRKAITQNLKKQNFDKISRKTKGKSLLIKSIPEYNNVTKNSLGILNSTSQNDNIQYTTPITTMSAELVISAEHERIKNSDNIDVYKKSSISFIPNILPSILTYTTQQTATTTITTTKSTTTTTTTRNEPTVKTTTATTTTSPAEDVTGAVGITRPKLPTTLTLPVVTKTSPKDDFISTKDVPAVTLSLVDDSKAQDITSSTGGAHNASSSSSSTSSIVVLAQQQQPSSLMLTTIPTASVDVDEKIIKSIDVEKIDLKSMKEYQNRIISTEGVPSTLSTQPTTITFSQPTTTPPPSSPTQSTKVSVSTTISTTTTPEYFGNAKKKLIVGGIVMGHDGIKVTKKKQLIEKNFKDDEILMRKSKGFSLDKIDEQKIEIGEVHKQKTNKKYHDNVTSGHLGPLIFKERVIEEHANKENFFFNKLTTPSTTTTTSTPIPIIKTEITTTTELIKSVNEFLSNIPNDNYDFFMNLKKRNDTQYDETERLRKISEFFPTNASLSEIFRSRTGFITENFDNIDTTTTTVKIPIDPRQPEIDMTTINTIFDTEEIFKMEKLDQDIAYSRDGGHANIERIMGNIKNEQADIDITRINYNDGLFFNKDRSQTDIDITTTNLNDAIMNFQDDFKNELKSEIDVGTTTKLNDEILSQSDSNREIDLKTQNFNGSTLVVEGIRAENNPVEEKFNSDFENDGLISEILKTTNSTKDTQESTPKIYIDFETTTTTHSTSKETFQTETISPKYKELTTTSPLESATLPEFIIQSKTSLTTLNTDGTTLPPGTIQDTQEFNENLQTLNKTIKKDTETSRIEIEINVSEGNGNFTSDLMQFSFSNSQPEEVLKSSIPHVNSSSHQKIEQITFQRNSNTDVITLKPVDVVQNEFFNETDILVVEITDGENSTDNFYNNNENLPILNENPKYANHDYDTKNSKNFQDYGEYNLKSPGSRESNSEDDDLFVPDLKLEPYEDLIPITASSGSSNNGIPGGGGPPLAYPKDSIDRDSDTIFYISNTEVKVVESVPTPNTNTDGHSDPKLQSTENFSIHQGHHRISKLESQFFPAIYEEDVIIDFPGKNSSTSEGKYSDRYQEDIILSPLKNNFDPLKIIRNRSGVHHSFNDDTSRSNPSGGSFSSSDDNMSVSYIAESFIDVEESPPGSSTPSRPPSLEGFNRKEHESDRTQSSYSDANENPSISSDVIIQPAIIPEISIGVPVIGELPPQIELKEIDFIPNGNTNSNTNTNNNNNNNNNNNDDSIQYGGDLIANIGGRGVGDGYDIETGYAFGGSAKIRENVGGIGGDNDVTVTSQIVMHAVDNLQKDQLMAEIPGEGGAVGYKNLPAKRNGNSTGPENFRNATADSVLDDNDGGDLNFTDIQTLFLACFATLVPLILSVLLAFGLRYLWMKYRRDPSSAGGLVGDNSTDPLAAKSMTLSQDELKSTESGYTINRSNDTLESSTEIVTKYDGSGGGITVNGTATTNMLNHSGANGSVITMTLKNNHLIVETEERNDISRDARETKMHYTPSEKDGVFVVEVARGVDSTGAPESPRKDCDGRKNNYTLDIDTIEKPKIKDCKARNHEEVQIHQPPNDDDVLVEVDENNLSQKSEIAANLGSSNTGLSQSDLSTSSGDSNKGYTYGNQKLYTVDTEDCRPHSPKVKIASPVYSPNECENGDCSGENDGDRDSNPKSDPETKPVITAALLKQDTVIEVTDRGSKCPKLDKKPEENGNPGDKEAADEKLHQEQQHQLGNGEISPLDNGPTNETENGFDSIISLPAPPSTEEIKQMNDVILMENSQLDSLPPPPPPDNQSQTVTTHDIPLAGVPTEGQNGVAVTGSS